MKIRARIELATVFGLEKWRRTPRPATPHFGIAAQLFATVGENGALERNGRRGRRL
ncbi:hypothetical protein [Actinomadura chibensis]|uniref:hypothetical protein n=1 Tax=Actinomadura chibensis TaxID=392828 RepID=UPI0012FC79E3|nr:hypothetical protein [Actinomadura chibensis]